MPQFALFFKMDLCYKPAPVKHFVLSMYTCKQSCSYQISYGTDRRDREAFTLFRAGGSCKDCSALCQG